MTSQKEPKNVVGRPYRAALLLNSSCAQKCDSSKWQAFSQTRTSLYALGDYASVMEHKIKDKPVLNIVLANKKTSYVQDLTFLSTILAVGMQSSRVPTFLCCAGVPLTDNLKDGDVVLATNVRIMDRVRIADDGKFEPVDRWANCSTGMFSGAPGSKGDLLAKALGLIKATVATTYIQPSKAGIDALFKEVPEDKRPKVFTSDIPMIDQTESNDVEPIVLIGIHRTDPSVAYGAAWNKFHEIVETLC